MKKFPVFSCGVNIGKFLDERYADLSNFLMGIEENGESL